MLPDSNSEVAYSQVSRQENVPKATRKLNWCCRIKKKTESDERTYPNSTSSRKLATSSPKLKKHGMHEPSIHEHDLSVFADEVVNVCNQRNILNGSIQNKCIDVVNVCDFVDESRHSLWGKLCGEFGNLQEHKNSRILRVCSTLLKRWLKNILKKF